jgi:hypothetical protein
MWFRMFAWGIRISFRVAKHRTNAYRRGAEGAERSWWMMARAARDSSPRDKYVGARRGRGARNDRGSGGGSVVGNDVDGKRDQNRDSLKAVAT